METNTNTPEANQPAGAGCHHAPCSPFELGKRIAREIFECGDEPSSKCTRIQFLGGSFVAQNERAQGGFDEQGLARQITAILTKIHQENAEVSHGGGSASPMQARLINHPETKQHGGPPLG